MGGVISGIASIFHKPKLPKIPAPAPIATRNMAAEAALAEDSLRRRRGGKSNDMTGGSAEASSPGGKTLLGQ